MRFSILLCIFSSLSSFSFSQHQEYILDPDTAVQRRLEEWQDLKFGLLMHWGTYSQWGIVESWSICPEDLGWATGGRKKGVSDTYDGYVDAYENLQKSFNPSKFDPDKWAKAAAAAGMKYVVFTTKHHDGFCMFDTKETDYKITDKKTPFSSNPKSNVTKEVFSAFRQNNFWVGAYFSKPDWHSNYYWWDYFPPSDRNCNYQIAKYPEQWGKFVDFTHKQIDELMSDYGKIDILWLDGGWVRIKTDEEIKTTLMDVYEGARWARNPQSQDINMPLLVENARKKQPGLIVVDRDVKGPYQNYLTPEQHIPDTGLPYPWETCMTMANSWSYVPNDQYKSTDGLLERLVDVVSKGGNLLLNIGPDPNGELDSTAYIRLKEIGEWMKVNGTAIYGTRMFKTYAEGDKIHFTQSKDGKTVYVFFSDSPQGKILLKNIDFDVKSVELMDGTKLNFTQTTEGCILKMPKKLQGNHLWVVRVTREL